MTDNQWYIAALQSVPQLGSVTIRHLIASLGSAKEVWEATDADLQELPLDKDAYHNLINTRRSFDWDAMIRNAEKHHVNVITYQDDAYPYLLLQTYNPPAVLFYQGRFPADAKALAIVGSRKATIYGKNAARQFSKSLAAAHITIISGGARGIDSCSHHGALSVSGTTWAILANGLDITYPPENRRLFDEIIASGGALLTEYPLGTPPLQQNFPARNRIISGLSSAVLVVEAAMRSGSLITADFALEEGRNVYAVPGSIYSQTSGGTNHLIQMGAYAVTCPDDILTEENWQAATTTATPEQLSLEETMVLQYVPADDCIHQENLMYQTQLTASALSHVLLQLVLKGMISEESKNRYTKIC